MVFKCNYRLRSASSSSHLLTRLRENDMGKVFDIEGDGANLEVYEDKIVIARKGLASAITLREDKTIMISAIRSVNIKKPPGLGLKGWITFGTGSGNEVTNVIGSGLLTQFGDNTFSFFKKSYEDVLKAKDFLEAKFNDSQKTVQAVNLPSSADELRKFKQLLDDGIISQAEFDEKKKQLLG
jgi:hypothetical protein